ncbi:MAG: N-acetyl-gamma-glutamyl-phosphate reductase [Oscillospiraceae bacterium]|nr:N-acetyl-gamma-glutamyl-phosphate reductase [Oscillospiraceae bacterium]
MSKPKVFIDGESGTVGLKIHERLAGRTDIELLKIAPELSENADERRMFLNAADYVFLCLPDEVAKGAVAMIEEAGNTATRIIDASTAHRTNPAWDYGFPELSHAHAEKIAKSKRVANPGCYASGFIALVYPLVKEGLLPPDYPLFCYGISGYSGAGKAFIEEYESPNRNPELSSARLYALSQSHKHQPEMQYVCGLARVPMFNPIIDDYYSGMIVNVPLQGFDIERIKKIYKHHYTIGRVQYASAYGHTFLAGNTLTDSDDMDLYVFGDTNERILLSAHFDNLGKGASGAAVQCFDLMLGG